MIQAERHSAGLADEDQSDAASIRSQGNSNHHPLASQNTLPDAGTSQEAFVSQVPAIRHPEAPNLRPTDGQYHPIYKSNLLGRLGRQSEETKGGTGSNTGHVDQQHAVFQIPRQMVSQKLEQPPHSNTRASNEVGDSLAVADGHELAAVLSPEIRLPGEITSAEIYGLNDGADPVLATGARVVDKNDTDARVGLEGRKRAPDDSNARSVERENTKSQADTEVTKQTEGTNLASKLTPGYSDPWAGLTRIRSHDIRIPEDQKWLLEDKRCWVPPSPGMDLPRGHVPPLLLEGWNKTMLQRKHFSQAKDSGHAISETPYPYEMSLSPSADSASDVGSEEGSLPWSSSPADHNTRNQLPADSSPARTRRVPKEAKFPNPNEDTAGDIQSLRGPDTVDNIKESVLPEPEDAVKRDADPDDSSHPNHQQVNPSVLDSGNIAWPQDPVDGSDGSDSDLPMDTSVPCPLLGSSQQAQQTSQFEQETASSGHSLPGLAAQEQIQVLETPVADLGRLRANGVHSGGSRKDGAGEDYGSQQRSSQAAKSSPQSRISNTYGSNENGPKGHPSQEASNSSLEGEIGSNIHVMGTQVSNDNWPAQQTALQSPFTLVLDSSERKYRERSAPTSASASLAAPSQPSEPSQPISSNLEIPYSQADGHGHGSGLQSSPRDSRSHNGTDIGRVHTLKRSASEIEDDHLSPSKRHKHVPQEGGHTNKSNGREPPNPDTATRRQGYIRGSAKPDDALLVHEKFQLHYPSYTGDFAHFTKLCSKLQSLRAMGKLQRSFLWDDFVIVHSREYPHYLEECYSTDTKPLGYEEYFTSNFSRPSYRRRSLTASAIDLCAAQYVRPDQSSEAPNLAAVHGEVGTSFTHSLVDKFSHFHAHSLGTPTQNSHSSVDVDHMTVATTSPHRDLDAAVIEPKSDAVEDQSSGVSCVPPTPPADVTHQQVHHDEFAPNAHGPEDNDDQDLHVKMEDPHQAASVIPGEGTHEPASPQESPDNELEASGEPESEPDSPNENWFVSLRHLRPSGPVWSDDRNTAFKAWARADQNVLSERRRRGGRYLAVDEQGVIQRTTTRHRQT